MRRAPIQSNCDALLAFAVEQQQFSCAAVDQLHAKVRVLRSVAHSFARRRVPCFAFFIFGQAPRAVQRARALSGDVRPVAVRRGFHEGRNGNVGAQCLKKVFGLQRREWCRL